MVTFKIKYLDNKKCFKIICLTWLKNIYSDILFLFAFPALLIDHAFVWFGLVSQGGKLSIALGMDLTLDRTSSELLSVSLQVTP